MSDPTVQNASPIDVNAAPAAAPVPEPPAQESAAPASTGKKQEILQIPANTMSKIRGDERRKGKAALAKELGFESPEALAAALKKRAESAAKPPTAAATKKDAPPMAAENSDDRFKALEARLAELEDKNKRLSRDKNREEKRRKDLQQQLSMSSAENKLRAIAVRSGIKEEHVEFALHQLRISVRGMSPDRLSKFDESAFFKGLKPRYPMIFNETATTPTTGLADGKAAQQQDGGKSPATPLPKDVATGAANGQRVDARTLSPAAWKQLQDQMGIRY